MSIRETTEKIKPFYTFILVALVACVFFALGRLSGLKATETSIKIAYPDTSQTSSAILGTATTSSSISSNKEVSTTTKATPTPTSGAVIGSKSGKKYYFPWCGTVKRILPQNQVHFSSIEEARAAGFLPGGNCKGLQ